MKLSKLSLVHFKNHKDFSLETSDDVIGIYALNGKGKTNILDAICFLCLGKSYFAGTDIQSIHHEESVAGIRATIDGDEIKIKFKRGSGKTIEKNGVKQSRIEFIGNNFATVISPGDIELVYGDNKERRRFVDQVISQTDENYLKSLITYNKLLEQRNQHLKSDKVDESLLNTFDQQMAPLASNIYDKRKSFFAEFIPVYQNQYQLLCQEIEQVGLSYISTLQELNFIDGCQKHRQKDLVLRRTSFGIHKDEIELTLNQLSLKKFGSQGQIKSALIALKLGESDFILKKTNTKPFLLLDDIFEKIDDERAIQLTEIIKNGTFGQIFITDTNEQRVDAFCKQIGKEYSLIELP